MDAEKELCLAGADPGVDSILEPSHVNLRTGPSISSCPSHPCTFTLSDQENHHLHPRNHNHEDDNDSLLLHRRSGTITMPETPAQSTSFSGPSPPSEARASGLDPTRTPPIGIAKPSHRTPYGHLSSHRSSSDDQLKELSGGGQHFSSPSLHPLSLRTRSQSPFSISGQRPKGRNSRARFTINSSPPNSPTESEPKHNYPTPNPFSSPFTIRGFLALSTFSKVIAVLFVCCVLLLLRALLGIGHSAESCGVYAHGVTGLRSGFSLESSVDTSYLQSPTNDDTQRDEDVGGRVWLEMVDELYGYRYDWKLEEYEIEHDDDGGDHYDDEYEHEDILDHA